MEILIALVLSHPGRLRVGFGTGEHFTWINYFLILLTFKKIFYRIGAMLIFQ